MPLVIEEAKETLLKFSQETVRAFKIILFCFNKILVQNDSIKQFT